MKISVSAIGLSIFLFAVQPGEASERTLVHILDYLARDYRGAVVDSRVVSVPEYTEQVEFIEKACQIGFRAPNQVLADSVNTGLKSLRTLVLEKEDAEIVSRKALELRRLTIAASGMATSPTQWPNLGKGSRLFSENCNACHGPEGKGDGPSGSQLDPPPANFHDQERMQHLSPFQIFNTIRLGVDGTGMPPFPNLSENDIWDLAFFIASLRHAQDSLLIRHADVDIPRFDLHTISTFSDADLDSLLPTGDRSVAIASIRLESAREDASAARYLDQSLSRLDKTLQLYRSGEKEKAHDTAILAYLEGIEPLEPRLRSLHPDFVMELEEAMGRVRRALKLGVSTEDLGKDIAAAKILITRADGLLSRRSLPPWSIFFISAGILLRESFEAILVIVALLGIIRSGGSRSAAAFVHGGWLIAVGLGFFTWFFSGWLTRISGAGREMTEGVSSLIAVVVLLYMGFWMHSKSEIGKWTSFIHKKVSSFSSHGSLLGLGAFSFLVVFREAFETVLFLSALSFEGKGNAILGGVAFSLCLSIVVAWVFMKFSRRIPVHLFFSISSFVMAMLSVILVGKGFRAFQETGTLTVTPFPWSFRLDTLGIYPSFETWIGQGVIIIGAAILLSTRLGRKQSRPPSEPRNALPGSGGPSELVRLGPEAG